MVADRDPAPSTRNSAPRAFAGTFSRETTDEEFSSLVDVY
jgi:hypothetical protein